MEVINVVAATISLRIPCEEVILKKEGDRPSFESTPKESLLAILATLDPIDDDFPPIHDPFPDDVMV